MLVAGSALLRLAWCGGLGLGNDEAYYCQFTAHPAWSYYDHPPMLAVVEQVGIAIGGGRITPLTLRLGFVLLFAGSTWLIARLAGRLYGAWVGVLAAVILNASAYFSLAAGCFALPDGPLLFFWLLTLERLSVALDDPDAGYRPWVVVGLAWGGALLSKYHAALLPAGLLLYMILEPRARVWLRRVGPYLALGIGLLVFSPVVIWNATHGWASLAFQGSRAVGSWQPRPDRLGMHLIGQALYMLPWVWALLIGALWRRRGLLRVGSVPFTDRWLVCQAVPPLGAFGVIACFQSTLPHWSLIGFVPLIVLLARDWWSWWSPRPGRLVRRSAVWLGCVVAGGLLFAVQAQGGVLQRLPTGLAWSGPALDPTSTMYGWDQVAVALEARGWIGEPNRFVFTSKWYHSGHLAYELGDLAPVLCYSAGRAHGFAQWSRPEEWLGWDGILVVERPNSTEPAAYDRWFRRIEHLGTVQVTRSGQLVRTVDVYHCVEQIQPFPFDGRGSNPTPEVTELASAARLAVSIP